MGSLPSRTRTPSASTRAPSGASTGRSSSSTAPWSSASRATTGRPRSRRAPRTPRPIPIAPPTWRRIPARTPSASAGGIPFLGVASDFGSKTFFGGLAAYAPFGGSVKWDQASRYAGSTLLPGAVDGPQRWQSISVNDASLAATAAFGARLGQGLSVGVGLTLYSHSIALDKALDGDGSDDVTAPNGGLKEGRALLQVSGLDAGVSAGLYWEDPGGATSPRGVVHEPAGSRRDAPQGNARSRRSASRPLPPPTSTCSSRTRTSSDSVRHTGRAPASTCASTASSLDGRCSRTSASFTQGCLATSIRTARRRLPAQVISNIPSDFHDAFAVHAGVGYWPAKRTEIFFDAGVDSSAVPARSLGTTLFDSFKILGTVGVRHRFSERVFVAASYTGVYYLPVTVTGETESKAPSDVPNANGSYASHLSFFDVSGTFVF